MAEQTSGVKKGAHAVGTVVGFVLALGLLVLGPWLLFRLLRATVDFVLHSQTDKAIAAAAIAGAVSLLSVLGAKVYENRAARERELQERKTPVYEGVVGNLFRFLFAEKLGEPPMGEKEMIRFFVETSEKLTIWGSKEVVLAFRAVRLTQKDLGHRNTGLSNGKLLGLFVNDAEEVLKARTKSVPSGGNARK